MTTTVCSRLRITAATLRIVSGATTERAGTGSGSATCPPSPHAVSAGRISVAIWPGGVIAACTAAAPSAPILSEEPLLRTQCDTVRAIPSVS